MQQLVESKPCHLCVICFYTARDKPRTVYEQDNSFSTNLYSLRYSQLVRKYANIQYHTSFFCYCLFVVPFDRKWIQPTWQNVCWNAGNTSTVLRLAIENFYVCSVTRNSAVWIRKIYKFYLTFYGSTIQYLFCSANPHAHGNI